MKAKLLIIIGIVVAVSILFALSVKTKPFDGYPADHIEELKQIPEVKMFYEKYGDHGVSVSPDGAYSYQVVFQSGTSEDQWIMLKLNYRFGLLSNALIHCTPEGIQSQYTVRDNVLGYLLEENCFDVESKQIESVDDFEEMNLLYNDDKIVESIVIIPKGVVIEGNENLVPKQVTVILGKNNTVTWINRDDTSHGIASDNGGKDAWGSPGVLRPGESFSITFDSTGIYDYHGKSGPWITGTVIVLRDDYDEKTLPSSNKYNFEKMQMTNACTEDQSFCSGVFKNGTQIMIQCDFPIHGCGPIYFDDYAEEENVNED